MDLDALQANYRPVNIQTSTAPAKSTKKKGRGGFLTSLISEGGALGGGLQGAAIGTAFGGPVGTLIGGALGAGVGAFGGRLAENKIRDDEFKVGEAAKEGVISGVAGAGPLKLLKGAKGAIKGALKPGLEAVTSEAPKLAKGVAELTPDAGNIVGRTFPGSKPVSRLQGAKQGAEDAIDGGGFMSKLTGGKTKAVGQRLTETGSGLKADKNVGGIAKLEDQSQFMTKYTGTPRQQRVSMETDMKDLSKQVDDTLAKTPIQIDGSQVGQRLKAAAEDLTDERYLDLDLNNPSVTKIIDRYSQKFAATQDAKGVNDIVKTLNKTATRAQNKLMDEKAGPLTAQEQAALALKRAGDDVLSDIPEIAPLKKNMAQIFEVTPQVAKQAEKGISTPLLGGVKIKAPIQAGSAVASKAGAAIQNGVGPAAAPGVTGFASRILAGRGVDQATSMPAEIEGEQNTNIDDGLPPDDMNMSAAPETPNSDPYASENVQESVRKIIEQGGTQEDVQKFLANAKIINDLQPEKGSDKPLSAEASKIVSNAQTGIQAIDDFDQLTEDNPDAYARTSIPGVGFLDNLTAGRVGNALGTSSIDAAADQITDVIARLRTGAAISATEENRFKRYIPRPGDPPETKAQKLSYLRNQFEMVANRTGSSGSDLQASIQ